MRVLLACLLSALCINAYAAAAVAPIDDCIKKFAHLAPKLDVDAAARTITFTIPASALGRPRTLQGARVHVTTWDYDGGYRALAPVAGAVNVTFTPKTGLEDASTTLA